MVYEGMIKCPYCAHTGTDFRVQKEWCHLLHFVDRLTCPNCQEVFSLHNFEKKMVEKYFTQFLKAAQLSELGDK